MRRDELLNSLNLIPKLGAVLLIGLYVFGEIAAVLPEPENNQLANASATVKATSGDAFTLGAVAIIVLVAMLILGLIGSGFSGNRGRGNQAPHAENGGNDGPPPMH